MTVIIFMYLLMRLFSKIVFSLKLNKGLSICWIVKWWGFSLQNIVTSPGAYLDWFHDYTCGFLIFILILVGGVLVLVRINYWVSKNFLESSTLEFTWTVFPAVILIFIGFPRLYILYIHEVEDKAEMTLKVTGHQWYWSYDYSDFKDVEFDRFILPLEELREGGFRLLEVSRRIVVPIFTPLRLVISSADVLHSWTIPSIGVKVDACPGRINFAFISPQSIGVYFGQCREICGANHSFMPIGIEVTRFYSFLRWLKSF